MNTMQRSLAGFLSLRCAGLWAVATVAAFALLAGCNGGGSRPDGGMSVDLAPILSKIGATSGSSGQSASSSRESPQSFSSPDSSLTVTPAQTLIVGALVVDFTDTPLGPNTSISGTTRDNIKNDAIDSIKFMSLVQLPTSSDTITFSVPPPGSKHWQVFVAATQDQVTALDGIGDNSIIWYGFSSQFYTSDSIGNQTVDVELDRACIAPDASHTPLGCAAYFDDTTRSVTVTTGVEIVGVYFNGSTTNSLSSTALQIRTSSDATSAETTLFNLKPSPLTSVTVDTTHQESTDYASGGTCATATAASLYESTKGTAGTSTCTIESYTTTF